MIPLLMVLFAVYWAAYRGLPGLTLYLWIAFCLGCFS